MAGSLPLLARSSPVAGRPAAVRRVSRAGALGCAGLPAMCGGHAADRAVLPPLRGAAALPGRRLLGVSRPRARVRARLGAVRVHGSGPRGRAGAEGPRADMRRPPTWPPPSSARAPAGRARGRAGPRTRAPRADQAPRPQPGGATWPRPCAGAPGCPCGTCWRAGRARRRQVGLERPARRANARGGIVARDGLRRRCPRRGGRRRLHDRLHPRCLRRGAADGRQRPGDGRLLRPHGPWRGYRWRRAVGRRSMRGRSCTAEFGRPGGERE